MNAAACGSSHEPTLYLTSLSCMPACVGFWLAASTSDLGHLSVGFDSIAKRRALAVTGVLFLLYIALLGWAIRARCIGSSQAYHLSGFPAKRAWVSSYFILFEIAW